MKTNILGTRSLNGGVSAPPHVPESVAAEVEGKVDADPELGTGLSERDGSAASFHIDPAMERRVVRKIDLHLMPLLLILCTSYSVKNTF